MLPDAMKALKDSKPARGTPIKFTRSLPAKAMASANVPTRTVIFSTLTLVKRVSNWKITVQPAKADQHDPARMLLDKVKHVIRNQG